MPKRVVKNWEDYANTQLLPRFTPGIAGATVAVAPVTGTFAADPKQMNCNDKVKLAWNTTETLHTAITSGCTAWSQILGRIIGAKGPAQLGTKGNSGRDAWPGIARLRTCGTTRGVDLAANYRYRGKRPATIQAAACSFSSAAVPHRRRLAGMANTGLSTMWYAMMILSPSFIPSAAKKPYQRGST